MDLSSLDPDVAQHVAKAYATFRERLTENPEIAKREPYVGPSHNMAQAQRKNAAKPLTVDLAFDLVIRNRDLIVRNQGCASVAEIEHIWLDYSHQYAVSDRYPLPSEDIASYKLSGRIVRDVFEDARGYILRKRHPRAAPQNRAHGTMQSIKDVLASATTPAAPMAEGNPYALLIETTKEHARWCRNAPHEIRRCRQFLKDFGFEVYGPTIEQLRVMREKAKHAHMYPRTFL